MKVFADLHHADLFYSLQLLFEKRLGWELYRPIGLDWFHQGYWNVYPHIDTAKQFLTTDKAFTKMQKLNSEYTLEDGIYYVTDITKEEVQKGITLDKFKDMDFDILISSMPQHIGPFNKLISRFQPKAKHIFQVGNVWGNISGVKNILASTAPFSIPHGANVCFYHQEFDLDVFKYEPPDHTKQKSVFSYIHYMQNRGLFGQYAQHLPSFHFRSFGAGMEDTIMETSKIADKMKSSTFTWHYKPEGDGFGHVCFNTYAVGRPQLVWKSFYQGKLADHLMQDLVTCIDVSQRSLGDNLQLIRRHSKPEEHLKMCENAHNRFKEIVNYEHELEHKIKPFLEKLL